MENTYEFVESLSSLLSSGLGILLTVELCLMYKKMGLEWWNALIPFYGTYKLYEKLYGDGWKFLLLLVPVYGWYLMIKTIFMTAKAFGKNTAFGAGILLLSHIFYGIIAFGDCEYEYPEDSDKACVPAIIALAIIAVIMIIYFLLLLVLAASMY